MIFGLLSIPLVLLLIIAVDEPLAGLLHRHGAPLRPFFAGIMRAHDAITDKLMPLWLWPLLLLLFAVARLRWWPHCTIWLVALLTMVSSQGLRHPLAMYFNRPRPGQVFGHLVTNADFWQAAGRFDAFPSGHAAGTAGLLLPWALRFPKARPWLLGWLGLVCLGRVVLEFHWLSDVVAGAALGLLLTCGWDLTTGWLRPSSALLEATVSCVILPLSIPFLIVPHPATPETESDLPPLLPSWRAWYWLVLGALALEIGLFVYLTQAFA
ncbi:phosphatase PAP2 family protein [Hymenobacter swuensis]|uniref:phosphatase PAP2 family protein n=1 Tax=Hymenobacter swuensis TaxID=1446467 RepID=UPI0018CC07A8|nr:phosphatase PAP2 family protein [Hymenobacter swuensis]